MKRLALIVSAVLLYGWLAWAGSQNYGGASFSAGKISAADGLVGAPAYTFATVPTSGMFRSGTGVGIAASGVQGIFVGTAGCALAGTTSFSGRISGFRRYLVDQTGSYAAGTGILYTNKGASGTTTATLADSGNSGQYYAFQVVEAFELRLEPGANKIVHPDWGALADGEYLYSLTPGSTITMANDTDRDYRVTSVTGVWLREGGTERALLVGGSALLTEQATAPATPASGFGVAYVSSTGGMRYKDDAGVDGATSLRAYGGMTARYQDTGGTAVTEDTPIKSTTLTQPMNDLRSFTHTDNRLTYTGTQTGLFLVSVSVSMESATGAAIMEVGLARNGTYQPEMSCDSEANAVTTHQALGFTALIRLENTNYLEVWIDSQDSSDTLHMEHLTMTVVQIE